MSDTHAHRPYWAWFAVPEVCEPTHDHTHGTCDLPDLDQWLQLCKSDGWTAIRTFSCRWQVVWHRIPPVCSCELCYGSQQRRRDVRAERRRVKQLLHQGRFDDVERTCN